MLKDKILSKIVVICGPTGSGKTRFAIDIASQFNGEIVNADSMQIYRYMNIGTAKPTAIEQRLVYHHMIDVVSPDENFNVAQYSKLANSSIKRILDRGRNVFVVGGTGLYIKILIQGLFGDVPSDSSVRDSLIQKSVEFGSDYLHKKLLKIDRVSADRIHKNDVFRIVRALEVFEITGKTITDFQSEHKAMPCLYEAFKIGLAWSRQELYERINQRVVRMISMGFVEEVRDLLKAGYFSSLNSMSSLGYRHICDFLNGSKSWNTVLNTLKRDHRRYAKRQLTWFNADPSINWLNTNQIKKALELVNEFL